MVNRGINALWVKAMFGCSGERQMRDYPWRGHAGPVTELDVADSNTAREHEHSLL